MLCEAYKEHAPSIKTCEFWFRRFKSGKKLMMCIWSSQQLMQLNRALKFERPQNDKRHEKVIFQHDNAQPHVVKVVKETLEALNWDVLPHPPDSPDIAPSDYYLFRSMAHGLAEQHFISYEEDKNWDDC